MATLKGGTYVGGDLTVATNLVVGSDATINGNISGASVYIEEDANSTNYLRLYNNSGLTANKTLTFNVNNADRTISLSGNLTVSADATVSGTNTGDQTDISGNAGTATTLQTTRKIFGVDFNGSKNISHTATAGFAKFDSSGNFTTTDTNTYSVSTRTLTLTQGTGVTVSNSGTAYDLTANRSWTVSIGQAVETTSDVTFSSVTGAVTTSVGVSTYRDHSVSAYKDAIMYSQTNSYDNWIYCDRATAQWGIYHRNIDSPLSVSGQIDIPANSIAIIAENAPSAYIQMVSGNFKTLGSVALGNTGGADLTLSTLTASGTAASPKYIDINFKGYQDVIKARIRSWDESFNDTGGTLQFTTYTGSYLNEVMRLTPGGNLLVGSSSYWDTVSYLRSLFTGGLSTKIAGTGSSSQISFFNDNGRVGYIATSGTSTSYVTSSDYRLKTNIVPMIGAIDKIKLLNPVTFNWKSDNKPGQGFIAHELQEIVPECVTGIKDEVNEKGDPIYQGVDTSFLVATLTKAIQEQQESIAKLTERIEKLEALL